MAFPRRTPRGFSFWPRSMPVRRASRFLRRHENTAIRCEFRAGVAWLECGFVGNSNRASTCSSSGLPVENCLGLSLPAASSRPAIVWKTGTPSVSAKLAWRCVGRATILSAAPRRQSGTASENHFSPVPSPAKGRDKPSEHHLPSLLSRRSCRAADTHISPRLLCILCWVRDIGGIVLCRRFLSKDRTPPPPSPTRP